MTKRFTYDCLVSKEDGRYSVSFPQIPTAYTEGKTKSDALNNAVEALELALMDYLEKGQQPPRYQRVTEIVTLNIQITDDDIEESHYITQAQAAKDLGVSLARVSALISSKKLESKYFEGKRKVSIASVNNYANTPRNEIYRQN